MNNIQGVSLGDLLSYVDDVVPANPRGAFGPFSRQELLKEVRRRLKIADESCFSVEINLRESQNPTNPLQIRAGQTQDTLT